MLMNRQIQPYHFTKNIGNGFVPFFEKVVAEGGIVCFDFEDSIHSEDGNILSFLKNNHRKTIIGKLIDFSQAINFNQIGFRINGSGTEFYHDDIEAIGRLKKLNCVFLPKTESYLQIEKALADIPLTAEEIIPIIETRKGFENLETILSIKDSRFLRFAFGHCDFNLSHRHFPFHHQDSAKYWEWIGSLDQNAAAAGKKIINSPVLNLKNESFFSFVLGKIKSCKTITGQITLCLNQTLWCKTCSIYSGPGFPDNTVQRINAYNHAIKTVAGFEKHKLEDRFFAVDEQGKLISPQEYKMAKIVLNISQDENRHCRWLFYHPT